MRAAVGLLVLAALVVPSVAQAAVTQSSITTPADPYYAIWNEQVATPAVTVSGTSDGTTGDAVDIDCYHDDGSTGARQTPPLASNVPVGADGSFSTTVPLDALEGTGGGECRLRAVPYSTTPTSGLGAYAGPRSLVGHYQLDTAPAPVPTDYDIFSRELGAEDEYNSLGSCGIDNTFLNDPTTFGATHFGAWGCNDWTEQVAYSDTSQAGIEIDGEPAYAPSGAEEVNYSASGIPTLVVNSVYESPANGDLTFDETDPLVYCLGDPFPANSGNCSTFVGAGVSDHRIVTETDSGHTITIDDYYSSTDGSSHTVSLRLENDQTLAPSADTSYEFPGQSSFSPVTANEQVSASGGVPATIYIENTNYNEPSTSAIRAAITYYQPPSGPFTFQTSDYGFDALDSFTVPATGTVPTRYSYSYDYTLAAVQQEVAATNEPTTVSITSPAPATTVVDSPVTVSGTVSSGSGVSSVTVNGIAATLTGTSWSAVVALTPGQNTLTVTATSQTGATATASETIDYAPPTTTGPTTAVPATYPQPPSNRYAILAARAEPNGTIAVRVTVPGPGLVSLLGTHIDIEHRVSTASLLNPGFRRFAWGRTAIKMSAAGTLTIVLHPDSAGARLLARHRLHGWALHVWVWTTYTPVGGDPRSGKTVVKVLAARQHR